jgi:hypothetical protein
MAEMSRWERVEAAVRHQPVDRLPWALWRHFYHREHTAEDLASAMLEWERRYDFDLLKVNPRAQYHAEVWGARYVPSTSPFQRPTVDYLPVRTARDWVRIEARSPIVGPLDEQLQALSLIRRGLRGAVPFVQTVFTPLGVAGYLVSDPQVLVRHMGEAPDAVHQALQAITTTFIGYVHEVLNSGAAGIFLATTHWATTDTLTPAQYAEFGTPYDLQILAAVREARLNVLSCPDPELGGHGGGESEPGRDRRGDPGSRSGRRPLAGIPHGGRRHRGAGRGCGRRGAGRGPRADPGGKLLDSGRRLAAGAGSAASLGASPLTTCVSPPSPIRG